MGQSQARPTNMSDLLSVLLYTQTLLQVPSTARPRVFHQRFATTQRPERYLPRLVRRDTRPDPPDLHLAHPGLPTQQSKRFRPSCGPSSSLTDIPPSSRNPHADEPTCFFVRPFVHENTFRLCETRYSASACNGPCSWQVKHDSVGFEEIYDAFFILQVR